MAHHKLYIRLRALISALFSAALLVACQTTPDSDHGRSNATIIDLSERFRGANVHDVIVVAHRGCWADAPENSIKAIEACILLGVPVVELDVRSTVDGVLVLMHDDTIDRTTTGDGEIANLTYLQLQQFFLKNRKGGDELGVTSQRVPTFEEAMLAAKGRILVNLDAKEDVYQQAFDVLERTDTTDHVIMKRSVSPGDPILDSVSPFDRVISMPVVFQDNDPELTAVREQLSDELDAVELIFSKASYGEEAAELAQGAGVPAWVNTLGSWSSAGLYDAHALNDPESVWGALIDMGYSIIQTDQPEALLRFLKDRAADKSADQLTPWREGCLDIHHNNTGRGNVNNISYRTGTTLLVHADAMLVSEKLGPELFPEFSDDGVESVEVIVSVL